MTEAGRDLSEADIKQLADFFYLLWQYDERNKREGRYDRAENTLQ